MDKAKCLDKPELDMSKIKLIYYKKQRYFLMKDVADYLGITAEAVSMKLNKDKVPYIKIAPKEFDNFDEFSTGDYFKQKSIRMGLIPFNSLVMFYELNISKSNYGRLLNIINKYEPDYQDSKEKKSIKENTQLDLSVLQQHFKPEILTNEVNNMMKKTITPIIPDIKALSNSIKQEKDMKEMIAEKQIDLKITELLVQFFQDETLISGKDFFFVDTNRKQQYQTKHSGNIVNDTLLNSYLNRVDLRINGESLHTKMKTLIPISKAKFIEKILKHTFESIRAYGYNDRYDTFYYPFNSNLIITFKMSNVILNTYKEFINKRLLDCLSHDKILDILKDSKDVREDLYLALDDEFGDKKTEEQTLTQAPFPDLQPVFDKLIKLHDKGIAPTRYGFSKRFKPGVVIRIEDSEYNKVQELTILQNNEHKLNAYFLDTSDKDFKNPNDRIQNREIFIDALMSDKVKVTVLKE